MKITFLFAVALLLLPLAYANIPPETALSSAVITGTAPAEVGFTARCTDSDGNITLCVLDFGEIANKSGKLFHMNETLLNFQQRQNTLYIYKHPGVYNVTLYAMDDKGARDGTPATRVIYVKERTVTDLCYNVTCNPSIIICGNEFALCNNTCANGNCSSCKPTCRYRNTTTDILEENCGNGKIDEWEECDTDIKGLSCEHYGYNSGMLKCSNCVIDITSCRNETIIKNSPDAFLILIIAIIAAFPIVLFLLERRAEKRILRIMRKMWG